MGRTLDIRNGIKFMGRNERIRIDFKKRKRFRFHKKKIETPLLENEANIKVDQKK